MKAIALSQISFMGGGSKYADMRVKTIALPESTIAVHSPSWGYDPTATNLILIEVSDRQTNDVEFSILYSRNGPLFPTICVIEWRFEPV